MQAVVKPESVEWQIENRYNLSKDKLVEIGDLLDMADVSRQLSAAPINSGFHVGTAGTYKGKMGSGIALGFNVEHGGGHLLAKDSASHAEDALIIESKKEGGNDALLDLVVITSDSRDPVSACGRCRDRLETWSVSRNVVIASGGISGQATMWTLDELLPLNFDKVVPDSMLSSLDQELVAEARAASKLSFQHFTKEILGECGVALRGLSGAVYSAIRVDSSSFYGTDAIRVVVAEAIMAREVQLDTVAFYCKTGIPTGEERQIIYDVCSILDCRNINVLLVSNEPEVVRIATLAELLPYPFGPGDIGITLKR